MSKEILARYGVATAADLISVLTEICEGQDPSDMCLAIAGNEMATLKISVVERTLSDGSKVIDLLIEE